MDFITSLLSSKLKGVIYNAILVVMNRFTKMIRYFPIIIKIDAVELAEVFHAKIICRYDISNEIISDRESIFISDF